MNLTDSQKKIFAILFAAGEPLETDRLAEALAISHAEAAEAVCFAAAAAGRK